MAAEVGGMDIRVLDTIGPRLAIAAIGVTARAEVAMHSGAEEVQSYAQSNAPWSDRTGDARNGLTADVETDGGEIVLSLYHTVDYGIWLETIQDGAFAIIMPTLEALGPHILRAAGADGLGFGETAGGDF